MNPTFAWRRFGISGLVGYALAHPRCRHGVALEDGCGRCGTRAYND